MYMGGGKKSRQYIFIPKRLKREMLSTSFDTILFVFLFHVVYFSFNTGFYQNTKKYIPYNNFAFTYVLSLMRRCDCHYSCVFVKKNRD